MGLVARMESGKFMHSWSETLKRLDGRIIEIGSENGN
jgi:hypothetical protein